MPQTQWLPGVLVLLAAVASALVFVLTRRRRSPADGPDEKLAQLDHRYGSLIAQLKALQSESHLFEPAELQSTRTRLEQEAAGLLKEKDAYLRSHRHAREKAQARAQKAALAAEAAAKTFFGRHPALKGALWGAGVVAFFAALGIFLVQESKQRTENEGITGAAPPNARAAQEDPMDKALVELQKNPSDLQLSAEVGHELIRRQELTRAQQVTTQALSVDPFHVESRVHRAVLAAALGDDGSALGQLDQLARAYPDALEALLFAGVISLQRADRKAALGYFERFAAQTPPAHQPPMLRHTLDQLRAEVAASP